MNGEDGRGPSDEREGKSATSNKLLHGVFPLLDGFGTCDCHRPLVGCADRKAAIYSCASHE
jgi:hypothetical protein